MKRYDCISILHLKEMLRHLIEAFIILRQSINIKIISAGYAFQFSTIINKENISIRKMLIFMSQYLSFTEKYPSHMTKFSPLITI